MKKLICQLCLLFMKPAVLMADSPGQMNHLWPLQSCPVYLDFREEPPVFTERIGHNHPSAMPLYPWTFVIENEIQFNTEIGLNDRNALTIYNETGNAIAGTENIEVTQGTNFDNFSWVIDRESDYLIIYLNQNSSAQNGVFFTAFDPGTGVNTDHLNESILTGEDEQFVSLNVVQKDEDWYWITMIRLGAPEFVAIPFNIRTFDTGSPVITSFQNRIDDFNSMQNKSYPWRSIANKTFSQDKSEFIISMYKEPDFSRGNERKGLAFIHRFMFDPASGEATFEEALMDQLTFDRNAWEDLSYRNHNVLNGTGYSPNDTLIYVLKSAHNPLEAKLLQYHRFEDKQWEIQIYKTRRGNFFSPSTMQFGPNGKLYFGYANHQLIKEMAHADQPFGEDSIGTFRDIYISCNINNPEWYIRFPVMIDRDYLAFVADVDTCLGKIYLEAKASDVFEEFTWYFHNEDSILVDSAKGMETVYDYKSTGEHHVRLLGRQKDGRSQWYSEYFTVNARVSLENVFHDIENVTVTDSSHLRIEWEWVEGTVEAILERNRGNGYQLVDTLYPETTQYVDKNVNPAKDVWQYKIHSHDGCGNYAFFRRTGRNIRLTGLTREGNQFAKLNWNSYEEWMRGVQHYDIMRAPLGDPDNFEKIEQTPRIQTEYEDLEFFKEDEINGVCYQIIAEEYFGERITKSNVICIDYLPSIWAPTAFLVHRDAITPEFKIHVYGFKEYSITVLNRWGQIVFKTDDPDDSWDGKFQGKVREGTYIFIIKAVTHGDESIKKSGTVQLIK